MTIFVPFGLVSSYIQLAFFFKLMWRVLQPPNKKFTCLLLHRLTSQLYALPHRLYRPLSEAEATLFHRTIIQALAFQSLPCCFEKKSIICNINALRFATHYKPPNYDKKKIHLHDFFSIFVLIVIRGGFRFRVDPATC